MDAGVDVAALLSKIGIQTSATSEKVRLVHPLPALPSLNARLRCSHCALTLRLDMLQYRTVVAIAEFRGADKNGNSAFCQFKLVCGSVKRGSVPVSVCRWEPSPLRMQRTRRYHRCASRPRWR